MRLGLFLKYEKESEKEASLVLYEKDGEQKLSGSFSSESDPKKNINGTSERQLTKNKSIENHTNENHSDKSENRSYKSYH